VWCKIWWFEEKKNVMSPGAPLWTNQPLIVYHGTVDVHASSVLAGVKLSITDNDSDFGRGFYTTTSLRQARIFAENSQLRSTTKGVKRGAVIKFTLNRDDLAQLESLWFVRSSLDADDFWNLIESCRRLGTTNRTGVTWYDIVVGPVARWYQTRQAWDGYDQISFHTDKAVKILDNSPKSEI
jgi:hypothetical protein